jgi:glycerol-3-phosphate acyltransferase PlsY
MFITLTAVLAAYLIGAVPFGLLVARVFGVGDIRKVGSGNIGATNVLRTLGMRAAIWVYLLDIGKGAIVVLAARQLNQTFLPAETLCVLAGLSAIVGHVFPVYIGFKGGKGVATACGVLLVLLPVETVIAGVVFFIVLGATRYVSAASIAAALAFPLTLAVEQAVLSISVSRIHWVLAILIGLLVPVTHRKNIRRLLAGTENRASFGRARGAKSE